MGGGGPGGDAVSGPRGRPSPGGGGQRGLGHPGWGRASSGGVCAGGHARRSERGPGPQHHGGLPQRARRIASAHPKSAPACGPLPAGGGGGVGAETAGDGGGSAGAAASSGVSEKERSTEVMSSSGREAASVESQPRPTAHVTMAACNASAQARAAIPRRTARRFTARPLPFRSPGSWPSQRRRP